MCSLTFTCRSPLRHVYNNKKFTEKHVFTKDKSYIFKYMCYSVSIYIYIYIIMRW